MHRMDRLAGQYSTLTVMRCVSLALAIALMIARPAAAQHYELRGGRWFDGHRFAPQRVVYVVDGRFTANRPARVDSTIDLSGRFIVAPYGEAHNHNIEDAPPATIAKYLNAGILREGPREQRRSQSQRSVGAQYPYEHRRRFRRPGVHESGRTSFRTREA